jgi:hypothetical protein
LRLSVLPGLRIALEAMSFQVLQGVVNIQLLPVLGDPAVPNNPAIEENQFKAFIRLEAF